MKPIDQTITQYKVSDLISWQRAGTLHLNPMFQRRPVWKPGAKSFFIDTVIRNLPIPIIILREIPTDLSTLEPKREVVDGQQRIRTLFSYIDPDLVPNYRPERDAFEIKRTHNDEFAGVNFSKLPNHVRQRILDYSFSVHVLPATVGDKEVLEIFSRLNATGIKLKPQELRNAEYHGEFKTSMYKVAREYLDQWRRWKIFNSTEISRMQEVELTSEFAILIIQGISGKSASLIDRYYSRLDEEFPQQESVEHRIRKVMDEIDRTIGDWISKTPFNRKTLFYSLFALYYDDIFGLESSLQGQARRHVSHQTVKAISQAAERIEKKNLPERVQDATERRTTHPGSRRALVQYLHEVKNSV